MSLPSEELDALQAQLYEALFEPMTADAEVETLQAQIDVYKMLVQLETIWGTSPYIHSWPDEF